MPWQQLTDDQAADLRAAEAGAAFFVRDDLAVVRATGKHRGRFLHSLLTGHVDQDAVGAARRICLCTAQGRIVAVAGLQVHDDSIALITAADRAEAMIASLLKFRVAERVKLAVDSHVAVLHRPDGGLEIAPDPAPIIDAWLADGATRGQLPTADALWILQGVPSLGRDIDDGSTPLEAGLWDAVAFDKGCYLGQEAIATMAYRGKLRRHLCWIDAVGDATPDPGWQLRTAAGKRAGTTGGGFIAGERRRGLAMVQRRAFGKGATLLAHPPGGGQPVAVRVVDTTVEDAFERDPSEGLP